MVLDCYYKLTSSNRFKRIVLEVPYLSRCIDMVLVDRDDKIISIEFKLKNWKKAIEQAQDHKLGVDKAYICMPDNKRECSEAMYNSLVNSGVGLFGYDPLNTIPIIEKVPAQLITDHWKPYVESLKNKIEIINEIQKKETLA